MSQWLRRILLAVATGWITTEFVLQMAYFVVWSLASGGAASVSIAPFDGTTVLCLGDSFTYGTGASAPAFAYPAQLERQLRARGGEWRVENRGWPGRNSREVLAALDGWLQASHPQIVCVTVGINDSWSHPDPLLLPEAPEIAPAPDGEPYVWTWRVPRLLRTFRALDPFRNRVAALAVAPAVARGPLCGHWLLRGLEVPLRLDADGHGAIGPQALVWTVDGAHLRFTLADATTIEGDWQAQGEDVVISTRERQLRLTRHDPTAPPDPADSGHRAIAAGDWPAALAAFRAALGAPSDGAASPLLRSQVVRCLVAMGRRDDALAELALLRAAAATDPCLANQEGLVDGLMAFGLEAEAATVLDAVIAGGANTALLAMTQALLREKAGDLAGARAAIAAAIEIAEAAHRNGIGFLHRLRARMHSGPDLVDEFAASAIRGHLQDRRDDLTRQLFGCWQAAAASMEPALTKACAAAALPSEQSDQLRQLLREALGRAAGNWLEPLRGHLLQVVQRCKRFGAQPILGTYPFRSATRALLEQISLAEGVPLVAVDERFAQLKVEAPDRVLHVGDGHCNDDGYGVMAAEFARTIAQLSPSPAANSSAK